MVLVKFIKPWRIYNDGEVAGWSEDFARKLVEEWKLAVYVKPVIEEEDKTPLLVDDSPKSELSKSKFDRLNADELLALAAEKGIDLGGKTLKKDVKPILEAVLFPDEGDA